MDISDERLERINRYWSAANYLTVGQIYLRDNPLLRDQLRFEHIKPRLLGHWGTSPGLSFIYAHLNRLIQDHNVDTIFLAGPGHGGPAILANVFLEKTYSEVYPSISYDTAGIQRLFYQFSTPGGVPSHVSAPTPGSIHEGGELGYVLSHAFGAAFDNPDLLVAAVVGDGEAETAPLEGAWKSISFLNPKRDGAVLPILHLNGYKISGPTVMGRMSDAAITKQLEGYGYDVHIVSGDDPMTMHRQFAETLEACYMRIQEIKEQARNDENMERPVWPVIVLRTPKGWTGPDVVDGVQIEGTFRSHQVPLTDVWTNEEHLRILESWMRSYKPEELFDQNGSLVPDLQSLIPHKPMSAVPASNGGAILQELDLPLFTDYAVSVPAPGTERLESTRQLGKMMRDIFVKNKDRQNFRLFCPDETNSNRLGDVFTVENRCWMESIQEGDDHLSKDGRVMEVLSEHLCHGWLEGYLLTGRHGLFATYESFAMVSASMTNQHGKWLEEASKLPWRKSIASLNILLTSTCWRNDHNGFSHQGPGLIDVVLSKKGTVSRIYFPPDANCLLAIADHCFTRKDHINLMVIDKQPQLQWLTIDQAIKHAIEGISIWDWAGNTDDIEPDVVLASAGDIPTLETIAAVSWLHEHIPSLRIRVVNVMDIMRLYPKFIHPHGMDAAAFTSFFTEDAPVIFAFHGYARAIHEIIHGQPNVARFHVRGFIEEGTTTTPFDMVVLNKMSRYHLCIEALRRARRFVHVVEPLIQECDDKIAEHTRYVRENLEDMPEVRDWTWNRGAA